MNYPSYFKLIDLIQSLAEVGHMLDAKNLNPFSDYLYEQEKSIRMQKEEFLNKLKSDVQEFQDVLSLGFFETITNLIEVELESIEQTQAMLKGGIIARYTDLERVAEYSNLETAKNRPGRMLPVFFIIDNSKNMDSEGIESIQWCVDEILKFMRADPYMLETCLISFISTSFPSQPLIPLMDLVLLEKLIVKGVKNASNLGGSLKTLKREIKLRTFEPTPEIKGDWSSYIFLFSSGHFDDEWEKEFNKISQGDGIKKGQLIIIGCGEKLNEKLLTNMSTQCNGRLITRKNFTHQMLRSIFKWTTLSLQVSSIDLKKTKKDDKLHLPPPPPPVNILA